MSPPLTERFWPKVQLGGINDCWPWLASKCADGYGFFRVRSRTYRAHRIAYELFVGVIPPGLQLDHLCRNRACVNPSHLEPVTAGENARRGEVGSATKERANAQTHCKRNHEFTPENTYRDQTGRRHCRLCRSLNKARRRSEATSTRSPEGGCAQ